MNELVFLKSNTPVTTSLIIAEGTDNQHESVIRLITEHKALYEVEKLQFIARTIIAGLLAKGEDYHLPYHDCKAAFETYARLSYINQRLLEN